MSPLEIARQFANALDKDDYAAAGLVIHPACVYVIRDQIFEGRDAILDSYRNASKTGRATFDSLEYASSVTVADDSHAVLDFIDDLVHNGQSHRYRCRQIVTIANGLITGIEHCELDGERASLNTFKRAVGIETS